MHTDPMNDLRGVFGLDLDHLVPGVLRLVDDKSFVLDLEQFIFDPEQMDRSQPGVVSFSTHPSKVVADFEPRDIVGVLENDEPVSLLGALMNDPSFAFRSFVQSFRGDSSLFGAHLPSKHADISGIRWTWSGTDGRFLGSTAADASVEGALAGSLKLWAHEIGNGLQFDGASPLPLQILLNDVQNTCSQLPGLWHAQEPPEVSRIEVFIEGRWCSFHLKNRNAPALKRTNLLPSQDLSVDTFARWISLAYKIAPFPFIVNAPTNILQLDAQVLGTVIEGLHQRLKGKGARIPSLSRNAMDRTANVARRAGVRALVDEEGYADENEASRIFDETLGHLNNMTYQDRALNLLEPVYELVPSLFGPELVSWVQMVKKIRNAQSHQAEVRLDEPLIAVYYVAVTSCRWALHLRILMELLPNYDLKPFLAESSTFKLSLANMDRERVWPDFSALQSFEASGSHNN